jgi:hypothetical protein
MLGGDGFGMLEFEECFRNVFGHIEVDCACRVVPVDIDATKKDPFQSMVTV